jgi:hypothetical protein
MTKLPDVFRLARLAALAANNSSGVVEINELKRETLSALERCIPYVKFHVRQDGKGKAAELLAKLQALSEAGNG